MTPRRSRLLGRFVACAVSAVVLAATPGCAGPSFLHVVEGEDEGKLEAEWILYDPPAGRPDVVLLNMVHFGSPEFYALAQRELDRAGVVLMEGVRRSPKAGPPTSTAPVRASEHAAHYAGAASELRLATQARSLVPGPHWRSTDLTEAEVRKSPMFESFRDGADRFRDVLADAVAEEVESLRRRRPGTPDPLLEAYVREGPLRAFAARALAGAEVEEDEIVIVARNEAALRALQETPPFVGSALLCFGAAHAEHFDRRLRQLGFERREVRRVPVFRYRLRPSFRIRRRPGIPA